MIYDQQLADFLAETKVVATRASDLSAIGERGENLVNWQLDFNRLSLTDMFVEYKFVVQQLTHATIDDALRLSLMDKVMKVANPLIVKLHQLYQTQSGFLNETQQQALDMALSTHYLGIMFFHSVWHRLASQPKPTEKGRIANLLSRYKQPTSHHEQLIQICVYGMMSLLHRALFEKYIGYREDTTVIWRTLNRCYRFIQAQGWQDVICEMPSLYFGKTQPSLVNLYQQCLLGALSNPYACRRTDILQLQNNSVAWSKDLLIPISEAKRPFIYVDLLSDSPPTLLLSELRYNPFAVDSEAVFINLEPLMQRLAATIKEGKNVPTSQNKVAARHANILLHNLNELIQPTPACNISQSQCQAVIGFSQIHYMLSGKIPFGKLIQAHLLPPHLRPVEQNVDMLNKSTVVNVMGSLLTERHLRRSFNYHTFDHQTQLLSQQAYASSPLTQLQVKSLVALYQDNAEYKGWQLNCICKLQQRTTSSAEQPVDTSVSYVQELTIDAWVQMLGDNVVACGVRLKTPDSRQEYFVPALIIPRNAKLGHQYTSLMMARFGYNPGDKLVMRIGSEEVSITLTELINFSDDVEEFTFVRLS